MTSAIMPTYAPADIAFEYGEGIYLFSPEGKKYVDFSSGIAVSSLGHSHPHLVQAIQKQAGKVIHYSNLYKILGQELLAKRLVDNSFASSVFFCNSGAEAVECGIKIVRRHHVQNGNPEKTRIITCSGGFHGRTLATLSAGKNEKHTAGFFPMLDGFDQVSFDNLDQMQNAITDKTAAILVEPIQGEGGINNADTNYFKKLRSMACEAGILLFMDEVQTGIGRTGKLFAHEWANIEPDIMAIAKALGGGFPIGACLATGEAAKGMTAGTHGSTFGGNPLAMAAANAVLDVVLEDGFLKHSRDMAAIFRQKLALLVDKHPGVLEELRGTGLMVGLKCRAANGDLVDALADENLLAVAAGENVVRFLPPLNIAEAVINDAIERIIRACVALDAKA